MAKIALETKSFWQIISVSIFKISPILHIIKAWWQWNLINFLNFANAFITKDKKTCMQQSLRIEKVGKVGLSFITGCFINSIKMMINHCFVNRTFCSKGIYFFGKLLRKKYQKGELGTTNCWKRQITIFISKIISVVL